MPDQDPRPPGPKQKRTLIESACSACRKRKSRCDGARPACGRCVTLHTECLYEAEEGESRWSALRRRNQILESERAETRELISYLQTRPEAEAREIFQRIRGGTYEDLFGVLRHVRQDESQQSSADDQRQQRPSSQSQLSNSPCSSFSEQQQRLPPIRAMFDVPDHHVPHPLTLASMSGNNNTAAQPEPTSAQSRSSRSRGSRSSSENYQFTFGGP
ncbi:hypothetical protein LTR62_006728 [Meristemomyces frigidus]|uniref:Zn(2)-C6 fungal-type domain-containing protein n=1 Tax=Meristemomyces frigidus TaxID=1508187 RepID=A0AAN7THR7_9PEZI|nr:hypothetical protein LTR62_006728 [Meristemomyces frigidus]